MATPSLLLAAVVLLVSPQAGERAPEAAVFGGVPQGMFVGRSLLSGRAVCLLFLSEGRITRAIPEGGLENFDWNKHRAAHGPDSGTWQIRGGQLVVTWGDGGVHQGPITVHPDGIEFYGKRYSKPVPVTVAALAGRWESARGTAVGGGAGINRVSELAIAADGRYQWTSTTGGVVQGRSVANDRSMTGTVTVRGSTIVFASDAGTASSHTLLPAAGQPVNAFSVDSDMFTRLGPAPARPLEALPAPSSTGGVSSHKGLLFELPQGWTGSLQQGGFIATPPNMRADSVVLVGIHGAERMTGSFDDWLRTKLAADLGGLKVLQSSSPARAKSGSLDVLSAGRTVQDQRGTVILQVYYAITDGQQAGLAMVGTANQVALQARMPEVQALLQSIRFGTNGDGAPTGQPPASAPSTGSVSTAGRTVAAADLVGHWEHGGSNRVAFANATSTRGYGLGYTFKADGTYTYFFSGTIDERTRFTENDSGTWAFEGGFLVFRSGERASTKTYRIIQFSTSPDGSGSLTLLDRAYPVTDSNVNVWGEKYVRKGR